MYLVQVAGGFILAVMKMPEQAVLKLVSWGKIQPLFLSAKSMAKNGSPVSSFVRVQVAPASRGWTLLVALLGESLLLSAVGFTSQAWVALTLMVLNGVLNGYVNILIMTTFQMTTPAELRGRVMGLVMTVAMAVAPLGMALGGVLGDATDKNVPLIYASCGTLMALSTLLLGGSRHVREFLAYRVEGG